MTDDTKALSAAPPKSLYVVLDDLDQVVFALETPEEAYRRRGNYAYDVIEYVLASEADARIAELEGENEALNTRCQRLEEQIRAHAQAAGERSA